MSCRKLSWKPERYSHEGLERYCSPACGHDCTRSSYDIAKAAAAKLAKRMGSCWKPHVWENLGWHYKVVRPLGSNKIELYRHGPRAFWLAVYTTGDQLSATRTTPAKARSAVLAALKARAKNIAAAIAALEAPRG